MSGCCEPNCCNLPAGVSLTPSPGTLRVQRGMLVEFDCVLTNAYSEPMDISLDTVVLTVKDNLGGTTKIQKTNAPLTHIDGAQGRTRFEILPGDITETETRRPFSWIFEVRRITPALEEFIHISGAFEVLPEVG